MKIYTRTGDAGTTSLVGGARLPKYSPRIEAYGTVDELNANIGVLVSHPKCPPAQRQTLLRVQNKLFDLGAYLAGAPTTGISTDDISGLEQSIDEMTATLPPIDRFILPGGCRLAALANVARTVCRRAERRIVALAADETVDLDVQAFINRLSDWLFTFGRYTNISEGVEEIFWQKDC
jgi:cob(I)alamin adenosyltransferase